MIVVIAALEEVWTPLYDKVLSGLYALNPWTKEQFRVVVRLLLDAEHAAVPQTAVHERLGIHAQGVVDAMVQANMLSFRPKSSRHCLASVSSILVV